MIRVSRQLYATQVIYLLSDLLIQCGTPGNIQSAIWLELAASVRRGGITDTGATTAYMDPGSSWKNG